MWCHLISIHCKNPRVVHCRKPVERWKLSSHLTFNSYVPCKCTFCQCIKETVPCKKFLHGGDKISCDFNTQQSIEGQRKIACQVYFIESAQFQLRMCMRHAESLYARNGVRPAHWISNIYFPYTCTYNELELADYYGRVSMWNTAYNN